MIPKYSFPTSHKTQCLFITKSSQLMLFREIGAIPVANLTGKIAEYCLYLRLPQTLHFFSRMYYNPRGNL